MGSVRYWNRKWDDCRNTALSSAFHCCGSTSIKCNEVRIARTAAATDDFPPLNILERVWLLVSMITFCTVAIDHKSNILLYSRNLLVLRDSKPRKVFYGWCFWPVHFYMPTSVIGFTDHKRGQFIFICVPDTFFLGLWTTFWQVFLSISRCSFSKGLSATNRVNALKSISLGGPLMLRDVILVISIKTVQFIYRKLGR